MNEPRGFFAQLRTVVVVTLITAMVWLLAESRMVRSRSIEAQISIATVEPAGGIELVVRQSTDAILVRTATIEVEGSTAGIDRFARLLQNRIELRVGREIEPRPGIYTLDLREVLRASSDLGVHGVTIKSVSPETVRIEVDDLETRELPLQVRLPDDIQTDGPPRAEPASVRLRAPGSTLANLEAEFATVTLSAGQVAQLTPGRLETIPGGVVNIDGLAAGSWSTTIEPSQVDVLITLKTVTQSYALGRLPVQVLLAPGEVGSWEVDIEETDRDIVGVQVEGPVEGIEALRSGAIRPQAFVSLSFEDLERGIDAKPAQIMNLPPGCRVVSPERIVGLVIRRVGTGNEQPGANVDSPTP
jgi:hypothetical protein